MSFKRTTVLASSFGVVSLVLLTITINLRSDPNLLTRSFFEMFSTSFAHPILDYNGTLASALQFFYLMHQTSKPCRKLFTVDGSFCHKESDRAKEICLEDHLNPPVGNCTILSFGIDEELNFEDQILMGFNCTTHVFDPSTLYNETTEEFLNVKETYHPIGRRNGSLHTEGMIERVHYLNLIGKPIHFIKIDLWGQEWQVLKLLLELNIIKDVFQLTFSSHLNFLKSLDVASWRDILQELMDTLTQLEEHGLQKVMYRETRNSLSSILFPGDDIPRPACGRFLYVKAFR